MKLVKDGPQQMLAAEIMADLDLPGKVKTKVVPYWTDSGKRLRAHIDKKTEEKKTKEKKTKEKKGKPEQPSTPEAPYGAFVVMEYAQDITNLARLDPTNLSDQNQEVGHLVQGMISSQFFYDLGRIHGADMYMGNEDRLQDVRTAVKNIFVNKSTGQLLPIDLGLVAVSKDIATSEFTPVGESEPLPASIPGNEAKDWVNLTITGSFAEREVPSKKPSEKATTTSHGKRGAAFFTPDFRLAVLGDKVDTVWNKFKQSMEWASKWSDAIDWEEAKPEFRQGVNDAITSYTSRGQGHWAEKVEGVKRKFNLGSDQLKYLDVEVFKLKDRYVQLIAAGLGDADARKHLKQEVEQGQQLPMPASPTTASVTTTTTTTTVPTPTPLTTIPPTPTPLPTPAPMPPSTKPRRSGIPETFTPYVTQPSISGPSQPSISGPSWKRGRREERGDGPSRPLLNLRSEGEGTATSPTSTSATTTATTTTVPTPTPLSTIAAMPPLPNLPRTGVPAIPETFAPLNSKYLEDLEALEHSESEEEEEWEEEG